MLHYQIVVCTLFPYRKMSHHKQKLVCGTFLTSLCKNIFKIITCHFTERKHQHDPDEDFGMGPSKFTDAKSSTFSEVSYLIMVYVQLLLHIMFSPHLYQDQYDKNSLKVQGLYFTEKKGWWNTEDAIIFTDTKKTTISEVSYYKAPSVRGSVV